MNNGSSGSEDDLKTVHQREIRTQCRKREIAGTASVSGTSQQSPLLITDRENESIVGLEGYDSDRDREYLPETSSESGSENKGNYRVEVEQNKTMTRKRKRNPSTWQINIRKKAHDSWKEYLSVRKNMFQQRLLDKKNYLNNCLYSCQKLITADERNKIFENYYKPDVQTKKLDLNNAKVSCAETLKRKGKNNSRRKFTFHYFFNVGSNRIQVCKLFYLRTLNISQTPIYNAHSNKETESNTTKKGTQARNTNKKQIKYLLKCT
ncbi:unnamed protein product [Acanthoscelides obtectus]|uniref:Uncharacterized protein n=1 Tax=Acanthoscelides obtectus TaxID=200917 RepID=A0A9P0KEF3_ACAOB|nr:unnamed protein product [Acanthoscelides obtectus]CAK1640894.1 hypothetical protein AOBTE_LOCUS12004 [Acanthoscelides obtectus]